MKKLIKILSIIFIVSSSSNCWSENSNTKNKLNTKTINENNNLPNNNVVESDNLKNDDDLISKIISEKDLKRININSSLMFSDEGIKNLNLALDAYKNNKPYVVKNNKPKKLQALFEENIKSYIHLGSILYNSPNIWSVWINDTKISARNNNASNELYIKSINHHKAYIAWTMSISKWKILTNAKSELDAPINAKNQVEFNFTLRFNQTFILKSSNVVEGNVTSTQN
jgi:hypothetical protein